MVCFLVSASTIRNDKSNYNVYHRYIYKKRDKRNGMKGGQAFMSYHAWPRQKRLYVAAAHEQTLGEKSFVY